MFNIFKSKKQKLITKIQNSSQELNNKLNKNQLYKASASFNSIYNEYILNLIEDLDVDKCQTVLKIIEDISTKCVPMHEGLILNQFHEIEKIFVGTYKSHVNEKEIKATQLEISALENELRDLNTELESVESKKQAAVKRQDKIAFGACSRESNRITNEIAYKSKSLDTLYKSLNMLNTSEFLKENSETLRQAEINAGVANVDEIEMYVNEGNQINQSIDEDYDKANSLVSNASFDSDLDAEWQKALAEQGLSETTNTVSSKTNKKN